MRTESTIATVTAVCLLCSAAASALAQQNAPTWKVGQEWVFLVKQYGMQYALSPSGLRMRERTVFPGVQYRLHVRARVTETTMCAGRDCVRIVFTSEADAPTVNSPDPATANVFRNQQYTLTLDARTWQVVSVDAKLLSSSNHATEVEGRTILLSQAMCFPIDWMVVRSDFERPAERRQLLNFLDFHPTQNYPTPMRAVRQSTTDPDKDGTVRISVGEVSLFPLKSTGKPREEALRECEQVWHPDELWWRSFRRYCGGHINLEATLVSDPDGSGRITEVPAPLSTAPGAPAGPAWNVGDEWRLLVRRYEFAEFAGDKQRVLLECHMKARVTSRAPIDGRDCARIEFAAEPDAPRGVYGLEYALTVDTATWALVRLEVIKPQVHDKGIVEAESYRVPLDIPGVPVEWTALRADFARTAAYEEFLRFPGLRSIEKFGIQRTISAPRADGTRCVTIGIWVPRENRNEATYEPAQDAMTTIEQVWHPDEPWWRSFRRLTHGHLELEVTRVSE